MTGTRGVAPYDAFAGPDLGAAKWQFLQYPMPEGDPWTCREPGANITVADGRLEVAIDRFELEHPVQIIDNCKFVVLSTESFAVPADGALVITAELSGVGVRTTPFDWRDGFASLVVIDPSTGLVFDAVANAESVGAIHEQLPLSPDAVPFTHVVEAPLAGVAAQPGESHHCEITLDAAARSATWRIDGAEIFSTRDIDVPTAVSVGMGVFTLHPVGDGASRSLHGQGFTASWSTITVATA